MTQAIARQIIAEATQSKHIAAELDAKWARGIMRDTGFRVRLTLKPEHRTLLIKDAQDWPPIRDTWQELLVV